MHVLYNNSRRKPLSRTLQLREAVLLTFYEPLPKAWEYTRLLHLSRTEWRELLNWLDTSGLALYFLDRIEELNLSEIFPASVIARLRQNLADNTERMNKMIVESLALQGQFQQAGLSYAVAKGFSLWPVSVQNLALRSQLDLDFLVAEENAVEARRILEGFGYRLNAISGKSWEFESNEDRPSSLKSMYKSGMRRSVELHLEPMEEPAGTGRTSRLSRTQNLYFYGGIMPVLSPVDQFVGQGIHVYRHMCGEFLRAAHLIEFYRHVVALQYDNAFWDKLQQRVSGNPDTCVRLGMVIHLISSVMGPFASPQLTCWTVDRLPATARLWVEMYGHRTALASFPGSKLYLLLQEEMKPIGLATKRTRMEALLPLKLPSALSSPAVGESLLAFIRRSPRQLRFIAFRFCFHLFEGIRYMRESILWRQCRNGVAQ
jgi:hypothetical protein